MKFTEYIEESSKYELKLYGVVQSLYKNCAPFIKELKKSGENKILWRGTKKVSTRTILQVSPRQDRSPKDMEVEIHDELDERFKQKFGWMARSEGVFVTSQKASAETYGDGYIFFPVGKYEYLYNPTIGDLFSDLDSDTIMYDAFVEGDQSHFEDEYENTYGEDAEGTWYYLGADTGEADKADATIAAAEDEGIDYDEDDLERLEMELRWNPDMTLDDFIDEKQEEARDNAEDTLNQIIKGYKTSNLGLAIKKKVEIMFRCKSYYLVDSHFKDDIIKYVLEGKPMKFDPKQKGLPYTRDPKWRKGNKTKPIKGDPFKLKDWKVSGMGMMDLHPKYSKLSTKAKKGYQLPTSLK
jgi:hypothetical protein